MLAQQSVYIIGLLDLILAGIAIFCVTKAEDHPEYFSLVYIAVGIFIFYMGTILIIIILQILETFQEQHQENQSSLDIQIPILKTQISSQLNTVIDKNLIKPKQRLSRSQTLPLTLSLYSPHHTSSSTLKDFKNTSSGILTTSTRLTFLPKYQQTLATIHKNYQSFAFITKEHHYPS